ncbi:MAG: SRPBCC family protein [Anaerolineae bacterium]
MATGRRAPVTGEGEIEVAATAETVWNVMANLADWPRWNPDVRAVTVHGPLAPGTRFRWRSGPGTITSTLSRVERPAILAWTGTTLGIRALHVWQFEPRGERTLVSTTETWEGLLPRLLPGRMQRMLQKALDAGLQHLKKEAERRR